MNVMKEEFCYLIVGDAERMIDQTGLERIF